MRPDPASFRDPGGRVYVVDGRVFRTVHPPARNDYEFVRSTGCLDRLIERDLVISAKEVSPHLLAEAGADVCYVLEHPRLDLISYPFEWSFPGLKAAALLTLDVHLAVLEYGVTMSDSSAYNVQFVGPKPLFIDYLSFRRYRDGEFWSGHRQFCEQFLNPLLLTSMTGVSFHSWYRGAIEGITATELAALVPLRRRISWNVMTHVMMQGRYSKPGAADTASKLSQRKLPLAALQRILKSLRSWVSRLEPSKSRHTIWEDYTAAEGYRGKERRSKHDFVREFIGGVQPEVLLDIGCNTGEQAEIAIAAGARSVIGLESDHGALDSAFKRSTGQNLPFLPLYTDVANPSPGGGWLECERSGMKSRLRADAVLALALIHHLAIGRNIPLEQVVEWIVSAAPAGVIEFVPKADPMVQAMLRIREDVFEDYGKQVFLDSIRRSAQVVKEQEITVSGRLLVWFERK